MDSVNFADSVCEICAVGSGPVSGLGKIATLLRISPPPEWGPCRNDKPKTLDRG